jgi:hypothetical protein
MPISDCWDVTLTVEETVERVADFARQQGFPSESCGHGRIKIWSAPASKRRFATEVAVSESGGISHIDARVRVRPWVLLAGLAWLDITMGATLGFCPLHGGVYRYFVITILMAVVPLNLFLLYVYRRTRTDAERLIRGLGESFEDVRVLSATAAGPYR